MSIYRYSGWGESEVSFDLDADNLMDELGRGLMSCGDLSYVLRQMERSGVKDSEGRQIAGIEELLQQLRQSKQSQLEKYRLGSTMDKIRHKLDSILQAERQGIQSRLEAANWKIGKDAAGQPIPYEEALKLMEMLQKMDELEAQLRDSQYSSSLDAVDEELIKELLGDEAAEELERLREIARILEKAGYIRWQDEDGKYELTPRGIRKIGQKALEDIFAQLRNDRTGLHNIKFRGVGGEKIEETKKYEFGDDFHLHLQKTILNSLRRESKTLPIKLSTDDFEVYKTEALVQSATVLLLDLSLSMPMRGNFEAAKRVAIALDGLIRSRYSKDSLHIVGFSSYAREIKKEDLACMNWDEMDPYTNMQHGLYLSRQLLSKERCPNKQIILISDGEPTAHIEDGNVSCQSSPAITIQHTLKEVKNCTQKGIVINIFMLGSGHSLADFVTQIARINKGRVFFTSADSLGQYLLVDYISNKKKRF